MNISRAVTRSRAAFRRRPGVTAAQLPVYALIAVICLAVVGVLIATVTADTASSDTTGLMPLLQDQAVNALSLAVLGAAAWAWFALRFRRSKARYLSRYGHQHRLASTGAEHDDVLVEAIVGQLLDVRPPRSSLVVSDTPAADEDLLTHVAGRIVQRGLLPVAVDVSGAAADTSVPALARTCFLAIFSGPSGDEPRAERLFRREVERHRVVVLMSGLARVGEARSQWRRRETVARVLRSCSEERLPFVATIPADLVTPMSEVAVLHDRPPGSQEQADELVKQLGTRLVSASPELRQATLEAVQRAHALSRWELGLAADVTAAVIRSGLDPGDAVRTVFDGPDSRRRLRWMVARTVGDVGELPPRPDTSVTATLSALGMVGHYRQELDVSWEQVVSVSGRDQGLALEAGLWTLARRDVVAVSDDGGERRVRFTRAEWFSFAGALAFGLKEEHWRDVLQPGVSQATLEALTMAIVLSPPSDRSPAALLARLRHGDPGGVTLEMLTAVLVGLQEHGRVDVQDADVTALAGAWRVSSDPARLGLLSALAPHPELAALLWQLAVPSPHGSSYRVRRAACLRLAAMAGVAWARLATEWCHLVSEAESVDLTPESRQSPDWQRVGRPFATLGWVLPPLVAALPADQQDEPLRLLSRMTALVAPEDRESTERRPPDVGLEISLAEGFKLAAVTASRQEERNPALRAEALLLFRCAVTWSSRVVLLQALALVRADVALDSNVLALTDGPGVHPFVREAAALVRRSRARGSAQQATQDPDVWLDDVQALQDGGLELSAEAHRLLALSTLLINLAEGVLRRQDDTQFAERAAARTGAFCSTALPLCFTSAGHTSTMFDVPCDCPFRLCGPGAQGLVGDRRFSRVFAQRAEATSKRATLSSPAPFVTKGFARVWRRRDLAEDD